MSEKDFDGNRPADDDPPGQDADLERESADESGSVNWARAGIVGALGAELAGFLIVGLLGGNYLDEKLGTSPLFLLTGLFVALAASGLQLWRLTKQIGVGDER